MSFFKRLFGRRWARQAEIEREFVEMHVRAGVPATEAQKVCRQLFVLAAERVHGGDDPTMPAGAGDRMLALELTSEAVRHELRCLRAEGVRDEDIKFFWNLSRYERAIIQVDDETSLAGAYIARCEAGDGNDDAALFVRKHFPIYGSPADPGERGRYAGDDQKLPRELHARVAAWVRRRTKDSRETMQADIEEATSMNALIRREIRAGRL